jgi:hypothetical protein
VVSNSRIVARRPQFGRRHPRYHAWMVDHSIWLAGAGQHLTEVSQIVKGLLVKIIIMAKAPPLSVLPHATRNLYWPI